MKELPEISDSFTIEGEASGFRNADGSDRADGRRAGGDDDGLVLGGTSLQTIGVGFTGALHEDKLSGTDKGCIASRGNAVHDCKQVVVSRLFFTKANLVRHFCGRSTAAWRVLEDKSIVELYFLHGGASKQVILLRLAGEAHDDVSRDGKVGTGSTHGVTELEIF